MNEEQKPLSFRERLNLQKQGLLPKTTGAKKTRTPIRKVSEKKAAENKAAKENVGDGGLDKWFENKMATCKPVCAECGMKADWLLEPQEDPKKAEMYKLMWRSSQAHILPKKKVYGFPSLSTNPLNHIILFPSFGGHLCGCHGFYDSNWYNASTMKIWTLIIERFIMLEPMIPPHERKNIPEALLKEYEKRHPFSDKF